MFGFGATRMRLVLLALIVAISGTGWLRVDAHGWTVSGPTNRPQTVEAITLIESLPLSLAPPVEPGLRLVALVASDIDADGDLDLVANDGSLNLIVWINDGTGHLARRYAGQSSGWRDDASTASGGGRRATVSAITAPGASVGPSDALSLSLGVNGGLRARHECPEPDSLFDSSHGPRAPPSAPLSI